MLCTTTTPRAVKWLMASRPARILHLFDEVCNLVNDEGDVVSLVSNPKATGPFSMTIEGKIAGAIEADMPVKVDSAAGTLNIGSLTIAARQANIWNPRPHWQVLKTGPLPESGAPGLPEHIADPLQQLIRGITNEIVADCQAGAYRLAGLGRGLTPTGDDVLIGVLHALWVWLPRRPLIDLIVETAVPRTTMLSGAFLRAAAAGEATVPWHDLANGRPDAVQEILAIGHTSGHDAWIGFTQLGRRLIRKPYA